MKGWARLSLIILIAALPASAQLEPAGEERAPTAQPDSAAVSADTARAGSAKHAGKSVRTAMLLSALIPGAGQFYNESYWKGGLIAAAELTLASFAVREHLLMRDVERMWSEEVPDSIKRPKIDTLSWECRDRRNVWIFFTGVVVAFSVADAYVDANMFGFKESQRLTISPAGKGLGVSVRLRF